MRENYRINLHSKLFKKKKELVDRVLDQIGKNPSFLVVSWKKVKASKFARFRVLLMDRSIKCQVIQSKLLEKVIKGVKEKLNWENNKGELSVGRNNLILFFSTDEEEMIKGWNYVLNLLAGSEYVSLFDPLYGSIGKGELIFSADFDLLKRVKNFDELVFWVVVVILSPIINFANQLQIIQKYKGLDGLEK